jgi:hypothetical protein
MILEMNVNIDDEKNNVQGRNEEENKGIIHRIELKI